MRWIVAIALAGCAAVRGPWLPGPPLRVAPGTYWFERHRSDEQSMTIRAVTMTLEPDGAARGTLVDDFSFEPLHDGELARDDHESEDMAGTWTHAGDAIEIALVTVRSCERGFAEDPCAHAGRFPEARWHLRCRAVELGGAALACARTDGELPPKFATSIDDHPLLLMYGPDADR